MEETLSVTGSNVFDLLEMRVQKALVDSGFSEPTLPQVKAIPLVLSGENVLQET